MRSRAYYDLTNRKISNEDIYNYNGRKPLTMGKIVIKGAVKRKPGTLYYVDKKGNLCASQMKSAKKKK